MLVPENTQHSAAKHWASLFQGARLSRQHCRPDVETQGRRLFPSYSFQGGLSCKHPWNGERDRGKHMTKLEIGIDQEVTDILRENSESDRLICLLSDGNRYF